MAVSRAPRTLEELAAQLPPSQMPGVLPRDLLPPGESVLFETRPGLFALFWGRLIVVGLYLLLTFSVITTAPLQAAEGGVILAVPGLLLLLVILLQWRHRVYALTDQRVIRLSGAFSTTFQDAAYTQVQNLTMESGGLRIDATPPPTTAGHALRGRGRVIRWEALSDLPRVYAFVQEAFALGLRRSQTEALAQAALDRVAASSIRCAYCGAPIEIATLDATNPRCPRCFAPVALPG